MIRTLMGGLKAGVKEPLLASKRRQRQLVRPSFIDYAVTWLCNARCVMCDTWKLCQEDPKAGKDEMTPAELDGILTRDAEFLSEIRKIGLTGGEPFLREDLVDLVEVLVRHFPKARISLVCNGLLHKRIVKKLPDLRRVCPDLVFSVSLDGMEGVHDKVRGIPGAFDKALGTIKAALEAGFTVTSGMTISELNYDQIKPVSEMLSSLGVDFSCNLMEAGVNFNTGGQAPPLPPEQARVVARDLEQFGHHYYMDHVREQLGGAKRTLPCFSGFTSYFLQPYGDVAICNIVGNSLGNLREQSFRTLADSESAWQAREKLANCTCWSQCEVKNSASVCPSHVLRWLLKSPNKGRIVKHYAGKAGILPQ